MRSCGRPRIAWFSASTRTIANFWYSATVGSGLTGPSLGEARIVELQHEPGIEDRLIFLAHRVGTGIEEFLVGLVIFIADARGAARRDRRS